MKKFWHLTGIKKKASAAESRLESFLLEHAPAPRRTMKRPKVTVSVQTSTRRAYQPDLTPKEIIALFGLER